MAKVYSIDGIVPVIDPFAFVHDDAVLIGDVIVGPYCYIAPCACLRGDYGRIKLKEGVNVQDTCVIHSFPEVDVVIENGGHIGHGAFIHGCTIKENAMIGMNAVIMDNAVIGENAIVAASSFVKAGFVVPPAFLAAGIPAKVVRALTEEEIAWKTGATGLYRKLTARSLKSMKSVNPLPYEEKGRERVLALSTELISLDVKKSTR